MAEQHGKEGKVALTGDTVAYTTEWSLDIALAADELTAHGDDWKEFISGLGEWSGSFSASYDYSDTNGQKVIQDLIVAASPSGSTANGRFYVNGSNYFSGTIKITGWNITTPVDGVVVVECTFQGSGAISYN